MFYITHGRVWRWDDSYVASGEDAFTPPPSGHHYVHTRGRSGHKGLWTDAPGAGHWREPGPITLATRPFFLEDHRETLLDPGA